MLGEGEGGCQEDGRVASVGSMPGPAKQAVCKFWSCVRVAEMGPRLRVHGYNSNLFSSSDGCCAHAMPSGVPALVASGFQ